jgi:hypothetical protein
MNFENSHHSGLTTYTPKFQTYKTNSSNNYGAWNSSEKNQRKEVISILQKKPCKTMFNCPNVGYSEHCEKYYHGCPSSSKCVMTFDAKHNNSFTHPCRFGLYCQTKDPIHLAQYQHPISILKKKECPLGTSCGKTLEESHKDEFFHPCQFAQECKNLGDEIHINRFTHPCKINNCKNKEEIHWKQFTHEITHFETSKVSGFAPKKDIQKVSSLNWDFFILPQDDSFKGIKFNFKFQVCSFNLLAQQFISRSRYNYVSPQYLNWEYRMNNLLKTIISINADVYCFQEVDDLTGEMFSVLKKWYHIITSSNNTLAILIKK